MLAFIFVAGGVLGGAGRMEVRAFEAAAAADIASKLGGGDKHVVVHSRLSGLLSGLTGELAEATIEASNFSTEGLPLFTEPERSQRGRLGVLKIRLREFELKALHVESLEADIPDCRYDLALAQRRRQIRLSRSGTGLGRVVVREKDLENFILTKYKEIKRVSVTLSKDKAWVEGYGEFALLTTNFLVIASISSPEGKTFELSNARILFDGFRAEPAAARVLLQKLNPVVDFAEDLGLLDAISVQKIEIREGKITASGATKIPTLPSVGRG